jgi:hypothetical protein
MGVSTSIAYYPSYNKALVKNPLLTETIGHIFEEQYNITQWKVESSANAAPYDSGRIYNAGEALAIAENFPLTYYVYPAFENYIRYYPSLTDAINKTNLISIISSNQIEEQNGITQWKVGHSMFDTPFDSNIIYNVGDNLPAAPTGDNYTYNVYPSIICFNEGTKVLCLINEVETYVNVENLYHNILVKTYKHGFKKLVLIGKNNIYNTPNDNETLYKLSVKNWPVLNEDLYITGKHSLLVNSLNEQQRLNTIKNLGNIYITDDKYRFPVCSEENAEKVNDNYNYTVYHFALEHNDPKLNYGIYVNGGLLVESCSIYRLNKSNLSLYLPLANF